MTVQLLTPRPTRPDVPPSTDPHDGTELHERELLETAASSDDLLAVLHAARLLAAQAETDDGRLASLAAGLLEVDDVATLAAIEILGQAEAGNSDHILVELLHHPNRLVRRHATWRLVQRRPIRSAYGPLTLMTRRGGMDTMHAHRALRRWAEVDPSGVADRAVAALHDTTTAVERARLVDLLGVVGHPIADLALVRCASDRSEEPVARVAAIGALSERPGAGAERLLSRLATDDQLGIHAALALRQQLAAGMHRRPSSAAGLRIAQLGMVGVLDGRLSRGGRGETGGVASLLVSLADALAGHPQVASVLTVGSGSATDALESVLPSQAGDAPEQHPRYMTIDSDLARSSEPGVDRWELLPHLERQLRSVLRAVPPIDVLHLRMADVNTLAGFTVARELGVATCFSLAPDPQNVIQSLQHQGRLDRRSFVGHDETLHLWFRTRLVEQLAADADRLAVFPRKNRSALVASVGERVRAAATVRPVPEGIDLGAIDRARNEVASPASSPRSGPSVLDELAGRIPADRRHLPLVLTVGRLHPVKGMERVAAAWGSDARLHRSSNLVIVGGDLAHPTSGEQAVLSAIDMTIPSGHPSRSGLVLLGGRPRADVAALMVAAAAGRADGWAPGGVYVDGALKEEFGLALLEALAAGLVVVGPSNGGPATYIDHGDTGILVAANGDLAQAVVDGFDLVGRPGRADRGRRLVEDRYSIETMAENLVDLYRAESAVAA